MSVLKVPGVTSSNRGAIFRKISVVVGAFVILFGVNSISSTAQASSRHYYHKLHTKLSFAGHHHHRYARSYRRRSHRRRLASLHRKLRGRHFAHHAYRHHRFGWVRLTPAQAASYPHITSRPQPGIDYRTYNQGRDPSASVLAVARRYLGLGNVTGSHRPWCADFVNMVLRKTGHATSGSGMARSLLHVGHRVSHPAPGDLVVMRDHVTIFAGYGRRGFVGLGGNQHHRVAMSNFPMRSVVAFVRPQ
jgi:uncharacterized protein (TIGR02594 family)